MLSSHLNFCCPLCKGSLTFGNEAYACPQCSRTYPIVLGIPDFRVFPDPYISYEDDYAKGRFLAEQCDTLDFQDLVRLYWNITPEVAEDRAERYMRHVYALVDKWREALQDMHARSTTDDHIGFHAVLEIGCGTGGFLIAASEIYNHVIGIDIAFRWLILAKKRLDELHLHVPLVCGCAEYLPFQDNCFDLIVADAVLEHTRDQASTLKECHRTLTGEGTFLLTTPNRFGMVPEPHVRVWGVGFLPRKWMNTYVHMVKGIPYKHVKLLSFFELRKMLRRSNFKSYRILLPRVYKAQYTHFSHFEKIQVMIYERLRTLPGLKCLLYIFGPIFYAICHSSR